MKPVQTALALLVILAFVGNAPAAAGVASVSGDTVAVWTSSPADVAARIAEDRRLVSRDGFARIGVKIATDLAPGNSGSWQRLPRGGEVWRLRVRSDRARFLVLGFDRFDLPSGARLEAYAPDRGRVAGPYTRSDVRPDGVLWFPPIDGDELLLELHWPASLEGRDPDLHLGSVSHGYRAWRPEHPDDKDPNAVQGGIGGPGQSGACNVDVACPQADDWQDQKRGVVRLIIEGQRSCSGSLVNNTSLDCTPLVLSAEHCYAGGLTAAGTTFVFNYERPSCGGGAGPGDQIRVGSTEVARFETSDFILLDLGAALSPTLDVFFNGWDRTNVPASEATMIHHPQGDYKKISYSDDTVFTVFNASEVSAWRVDDWESGTGEDGSSGAPLFDQNGRIVGQLAFGAIGGCSNPGGFDDFGRFELSWNGAFTPETRLRDTLDPAVTGQTTLNGMDQSFCGALGPRLEFVSVAVDDSQGNHDGVLDPGDVARLNVQARNDGPLNATAVSATLSTEDPAVTVAGGSVDWPDLASGTVAGALGDFLVDVDPERVCGSTIAFDLMLQSAEGSWTDSFNVATGAPAGTTNVFEDDMESGQNGWVPAIVSGTNPWIQVDDGGDMAWYVEDIIAASESTLTIPDLALFDNLPPNAVLRFRHHFDVELAFDGGVLEFTTDPSRVVWQDAMGLFVSGGYNGAISASAVSPLAGRPAWTGNLGGEQTVVVDLASLAGQNVRLRWRFATDQAVGPAPDGWYVDDVTLETIAIACGPTDFRFLPGARCLGLREGMEFFGGACGLPRPGGPRVTRTPRTGR